MSVQFTIKDGLPLTIIEGDAYRFTVSPSAVPAQAAIRWEITAPDGTFVLSGVQDFAAPASPASPAAANTENPASQIIIALSDDDFAKLPNNFQIQVYAVFADGDEALLGAQEVALQSAPQSAPSDTSDTPFSYHLLDADELSSVFVVKSAQDYALPLAANGDSFYNVEVLASDASDAAHAPAPDKSVGLVADAVDVTTYQWQVAQIPDPTDPTDPTAMIWLDISGATEITYEVDEAHAGKQIRARIARTSTPYNGGVGTSGIYGSALAIDSATVDLVWITYSGATSAMAGTTLSATAATGDGAPTDDSAFRFATDGQTDDAATIEPMGDGVAPPPPVPPSVPQAGEAAAADDAATAQAASALADYVTTDEIIPTLIDPSAYKVLSPADGQLFIDGTSADELIIGDDGDNIINTGGGDDVVIGGRGADTITLDSGAESLIYRYKSASDAPAQGIDGNDKIYGFARGIDSLILVDLGFSEHQNKLNKDGLNEQSFVDSLAVQGIILRLHSTGGDKKLDVSAADGGRYEFIMSFAAPDGAQGAPLPTNMQPIAGAKTGDYGASISIEFDRATSAWLAKQENWERVTNGGDYGTGKIATADGLRYLFADTDAEDDLFVITDGSNLGVDIL